MRKLLKNPNKEDSPPKKVKDTHILVLVPDKLTLNSLKELIYNELKISIRAHNPILAE